jgi:Zn-dependent peptidase ImmA (M78 family)
LKSKEWNILAVEHQLLIKKYQKDIPLKLGSLAKDLGIVVKKATLEANISGEIKESDGVVTIRINRHDAPSRQRYTLAHEISHFFLHRHLLKNGIKDILMPIELVQLLINKYSVDDLDKEQVYERVAEELFVSKTALIIRLNKV